MKPKEPSKTALAAAGYRAVHQELEQGKIFKDPLAIKFLGSKYSKILETANLPHKKSIRIFIATRTRFAEDCINESLSRGIRQLVVLGAGLDTFAYRNPYETLRVFEVDFPATQLWKIERLSDSGVNIPKSVTFAPVDFENESLENGLLKAGFDPNLPTFFSWLGVVPYLTEQAIFSTLAYIASLPMSEVVFDYSEPVETLENDALDSHLLRSKKVAEIGEPFISFFDPAELAANLLEIGFTGINDPDVKVLLSKYTGVDFSTKNKSRAHMIHVHK
ncbi:hypothetical protein HK096_006821 [Nowakowskiella sp. JEL0078]|nr:hypothetical protein HK096_006821 [Nowakowskiella sp. JEL0078]